MEFPDDLRYSEQHEWIRVESGRATVGITDYAQDALGDVVYVQLPAVGSVLARGERVCEVESTKSVSDIYAPISGAVAEVNDQLVDGPERLNTDPYGDGWIFTIDVPDGNELDELMRADAYRRFVEQ